MGGAAQLQGRWIGLPVGHGDALRWRGVAQLVGQVLDIDQVVRIPGQTAAQRCLDVEVVDASDLLGQHQLWTQVIAQHAQRRRHELGQAHGQRRGREAGIEGFGGCGHGYPQGRRCGRPSASAHRQQAQQAQQQQPASAGTHT